MPASVAISATTSLWCGNSSAICFDVGTVRTQASIDVIFMSVGLDSGELHRASPFGDFREVERAEFGGRIACGVDALLVELLAHFRVRHRAADFGAETLDHRLRAAAGGEDTIPGENLVARN